MKDRHDVKKCLSPTIIRKSLIGSFYEFMMILIVVTMVLNFDQYWTVQKKFIVLLDTNMGCTNGRAASRGCGGLPRGRGDLTWLRVASTRP